MNQYLVIKTQQTAVEAENPEDAVRQTLEGKGIPSGVTYNVQIRPKPTIVGGRPANG